MSMTELEAARLVRAALGLIIDHLGTDPGTEGIPAILDTARGHVGRAIHHLEKDAPPWEPEPSTERPWSEVIPGDSVQAPNGTWYRLDSVARLDVERMSVLLVAGDQKIPSRPKAGDRVPVRRGPEGKAVDIFRAGGLELSVMEAAA